MKLLTFFANNWVLLTYPIMYVSLTLTLVDCICGWFPKFMYPHTAIYVTAIMFVFWVFAPTWLNKYSTVS